jgi:hypothetical protein
LRRGNLEVIDFFKTEIASLRSQRRLKDFFSDLLRQILPGFKPQILTSSRSLRLGGSKV